jgi:hypothetical protein
LSLIVIALVPGPGNFADANFTRTRGEFCVWLVISRPDNGSRPPSSK